MALLALALKNLAYESIFVNLMKNGGEQFSDDYTDINPMHQVPTIVIDGFTLTQSVSIIEYLDESFANTGIKLLPANIDQRAHARCIVEIINSGIQPLQNISTLKAVKVDPQIWAHDAIKNGFIAIEKMLSRTAKSYCVGDEISVADIFLVPQVFNANRFKVDMGPFPIISRINNTLCLHEAFKTAAPNSQADCPADQR